MSNFSYYLRGEHWKFGKVGLFILIGVAIASILSQCANARKTLNQAEAAYKQANCQEAITLFNKSLGSIGLDEDEIARAKAKTAECQAFQAGVDAQTNGNLPIAMQSYTSFMDSYNNSPLTPIVRQKTSSLLQQSKPETIVQPSVCDRLNLIVENQLLPEPQKNLPLYYQACGQVYAKNAQYNQAIATYENFLQNYPKHSLVPDIKTALATATLAAAKTESGGEIAPPQATGTTALGSTVVLIRNDSPEPLQIVFSASQPRFEELPACKDCQTFDIRPKTCPAKGQMGRYVLKPGTYDVVVKSPSNNGSRVIPFTGKWALKNGTEYAHCFYIVKGLTPPPSETSN